MNRKIKTILITIMLLITTFSIFSLSNVEIVSAASWSYYKEIKISGAIDDYQMKLRVLNGTGTDDVNNGIFYCNDTCKNFPYDIRFSYSTSVGDWLPQWHENQSATETTIWVNISNYSTIYMFTGNSGVSQYSDGDAVFRFYDGFDNNTVDFDKWHHEGWSCNPDIWLHDGWATFNTSFGGDSEDKKLTMLGSNHYVIEPRRVTGCSGVGDDKAVSFNGNRGFLQFCSSHDVIYNDVGNTLSLEAYVNLQNNDQTDNAGIICWEFRQIYADGGDWQTPRNYREEMKYELVFDDSERPVFVVTNSSATTKLTAISSLKDSSWHHIAGTWDGNTMRIYVDKVMENSVSKEGTLDIQDGYRGNKGVIGCEYHSWVSGGYSPIYFNGYIDSVAIWNDTRTHDEVNNSYDNYEPVDYSDCISYWNMDKIVNSIHFEDNQSYFHAAPLLFTNNMELTNVAMRYRFNISDADGGNLGIYSGKSIEPHVATELAVFQYTADEFVCKHDASKSSSGVNFPSTGIQQFEIVPDSPNDIEFYVDDVLKNTIAGDTPTFGNIHLENYGEEFSCDWCFIRKYDTSPPVFLGTSGFIGIDGTECYETISFGGKLELPIEEIYSTISFGGKLELPVDKIITTISFGGKLEIAPPANVTVRTNGTGFFCFRGSNTTAANFSTNITGFDEANEYISVWKNDIWSTEDWMWIKYYGDGSGIDFELNRFDVVRIYLDDGDSTIVIIMNDTEHIETCSGRTVNLSYPSTRGIHHNRGYNYTCFCVNVSGCGCGTLKAVALNSPLTNGESIAYWDSDYYLWRVWIVGFTPDSMNYNIDDYSVFETKVNSNKQWVMP